jgi:hypothetical protein
MLEADRPERGADGDLVGRLTATWLTLLSCLEVADRDTATELHEAMLGLDHMADLASALSADAQSPWFDGMDEIDELARDILEHLQREPHAVLSDGPRGWVAPGGPSEPA